MYSVSRSPSYKYSCDESFTEEFREFGMKARGGFYLFCPDGHSACGAQTVAGYIM